MSKALVKSSDSGPHAVPALCSALLPGLGQLVKGDTDKGVGVLAVWVVAGSSFLGALPLLGGVAGLVCGATWLYGVADAALAKKK
jgi:hypothetical protein